MFMRTTGVEPEQQDVAANSRFGRWSKHEHEMFLEGLSKYGREWKHVARHVGTRSSAQIRSHAQKYFSKLDREMKAGIHGGAAELHGTHVLLGRGKKRKSKAKVKASTSDKVELAQETQEAAPGKRKSAKGKAKGMRKKRGMTAGSPLRLAKAAASLYLASSGDLALGGEVYTSTVDAIEAAIVSEKKKVSLPPRKRRREGSCSTQVLQESEKRLMAALERETADEGLLGVIQDSLRLPCLCADTSAKVKCPARPGAPQAVPPKGCDTVNSKILAKANARLHSSDTPVAGKVRAMWASRSLCLGQAPLHIASPRTEKKRLLRCTDSEKAQSSLRELTDNEVNAIAVLVAAGDANRQTPTTVHKSSSFSSPPPFSAEASPGQGHDQVHDQVHDQGQGRGKQQERGKQIEIGLEEPSRRIDFSEYS